MERDQENKTQNHKQKMDYNIILRYNDDSKVLSIPTFISFSMFCDAIKRKYSFGPNWFNEYLMMYRYKDGLFSIAKESDLQEMIKNNVQLITFYIKEVKDSKDNPPKEIKWVKSSIFSTQPKKLKKHKIKCNNCNQMPIIGYRFMCTLCCTMEYNLCETCFSKRKVNKTHEHYHSFMIIESTDKYEDESIKRYQANLEKENEIERERVMNFCARLEPVNNVSIYKNKGNNESLCIEKREMQIDSEEIIEDKLNGEEKNMLDHNIVTNLNNDYQDNHQLEQDNRNHIEGDNINNKGDEIDQMLSNQAEAYELLTENYSDLFTDESTNDDLGKKSYEDDKIQDYKITVNNNEMKIQEYSKNKNWVCVEIPFETKFKELVCISLSSSQLEPNIKYINFDEKKVTFMFKELTEQIVNNTYEYHFQLCSINTKIIHRSSVCKIMIIIRN